MENQKFLTIVDSFSKFAQAYPINSLQPTEIADNLLNYISVNGTPKLVITDNGGEFKNNILHEFFKLHKINIHFTSSQHPESNGVVERFHSTLIEHVRIFNNRENFKDLNISTKVLYAIIAYNSTRHTATKLSPFEIKNGHLENDDPLNLADMPVISEYVQTHKENTKKLYEEICEKLKRGKEKVTNKINTKREKLPDISEKVFIQNKQKCIKTKNKYNCETLKEINKNLKIGKIIKRNPQKTEKIHLSNIKRPRKLNPLNF